MVLMRGLKNAVSLISTITGRNHRFIYKKDNWSIGIYVGDSPLNLAPSPNIKNPVLTAKDVTDISADFVADPFMVKENDTWYMFFEVLNKRTQKGEIGYATSSDVFKWAYQSIVLHEPFNLSYPYVFKWEGEYYLIPSCGRSGSLRLYKSLRFPTEWSLFGTMLPGIHRDASFLRYENRWWLFAGSGSIPERNDVLRLYFSDNLNGPWIEHPKSPIVDRNAHIARPAGRMLVFRDRILRFTQDDYLTYGSQVRALEITKLTSTSYEERELSEALGLKQSGSGWNAAGMHHVDVHQIDGHRWIACVDGYRECLSFNLRSSSNIVTRDAD